MHQRYVFRDFVLNRSFKYYIFNIEKQRIEEFRQLDAREKEQLSCKWHSFGFHNEHEAIQAIDHIMQQSDWGGAWEYVESISCLNLEPGISIEIELDYCKKVRLLYIGGFDFYVCSDDAGLLCSRDLLTAIHGGITCSQPAYFCVTRDSLPFPQPATAVVFTPQRLRRSISNMVEQSSVPTKCVSHQSLSSVYAWRAFSDKPGHVWFPEEQLTDNPDAAFHLDLTSGTFILSSGLNLRIYNEAGINLIRDVLNVAAIVDGNDWSSIRLSRLVVMAEGSFCLDNHTPKLVVTRRMTITSH